MSGMSTNSHPITPGQGALDDKTMGELREIAARYPQARSGLLPMLHLVQSVEGRVTSAGIEACAEILGITACRELRLPNVAATDGEALEVRAALVAAGLVGAIGSPDR